ncbi:MULTISPECIES: flagellar hook-associated protein FlgL [unclassified Lebetimonas]|uniref:flagellar hook-associated protein FlgL n=1 Tax=unclassified Lebetimonas TaxID=2648158 RepID=UPI00046408EF|nr:MULTISPECIES: flagellar hook-associated protein FlgL [unclassified Lebetimonas]
MRVTQFTMYNNFLINQQRTLSELNKTTTELSTGKKIQNMDDNPTVFVNDLKFQERLNTFTQIKNSANFAKTFANETDTTMNDIVTTLDSFKTKLLNAANDTNDKTSREAIADELEGELNHLKDLANTSIDGKYIFSGSMFNTKPVNDELKYQGNGESVKAFLGAGVEREYNIDGKSLFLGRDNDYNKHLSLNIPQFDKMKANPQFVVRGSDGKLYIDKHIKEHNQIPDSDSVAQNIPVSADSEIRMLSGVEDNYDSATKTYSDGTSYFYIKGKNPQGETINSKIALKNSEKVSTLLEKIGELYGNTQTTKKVDVSINKMGEIQIKDVNSGKLITDFYMVASDRDENSLEDVVKNGDYIVEFQKSNFNSIRNLDTIKANNGYFDNRIFKFGSIFRLIDNSRDALPSDLIQNIIGSKAIRSGDGSIQTIDHLTLRGTDTNGNSVNATLNITSTTTMHDLIDKIKSNFGDVDVKIEKGELIITDNSLTNKNDTSKFSVSIEADDSSGNKLQAFRSKDAVNFDKLFMGKNGNLIEGNKTQIIKDYKTYIKDGVIYKIENPDAQGIATDDTSLTDVMGTDEMPQTLEIRFRDKNGDFNTAKIVLQDSEDSDGHLSYFEINGSKYDIFDSQGNKTPAHDIITTYSQTDPNNCKICQKEKRVKGFTFRQLGDVISMITSGNVPANNDESDYFTALDNAKKEVKSGMENGHFYVKDLNNNPSKIDISIFDENNNVSFQANDAITIDSAKVDFFSMLQNAINAVKNGTNYPDGNSDNPRNFGIQGAIEEIDHLSDHVRKLHAKIGAVSNEFEMSIERVDTLMIHTKTLQSENIDTDIGEATMRLNSLKTSYQALLASIAKVNDLTLLNYLR